MQDFNDKIVDTQNVDLPKNQTSDNNLENGLKISSPISDILEQSASIDNEFSRVILSYGEILNRHENLTFDNISLIEKNFELSVPRTELDMTLRHNSLEYLNFLRTSALSCSSNSGDLFLMNFSQTNLKNRSWENKQHLPTIAEASPRSENPERGFGSNLKNRDEESSPIIVRIREREDSSRINKDGKSYQERGSSPINNASDERGSSPINISGRDVIFRVVSNKTIALGSEDSPTQEIEQESPSITVSSYPPIKIFNEEKHIVPKKNTSQEALPTSLSNNQEDSESKSPLLKGSSQIKVDATLVYATPQKDEKDVENCSSPSPNKVSRRMLFEEDAKNEEIVPELSGGCFSSLFKSIREKVEQNSR